MAKRRISTAGAGDGLASAAAAGRLLAGIDFTCNPSRRKSITVATGRLDGLTLRVGAVECLPTLDAFSAWLDRHGPWLGAFDFPFGLPRAFVESLGLGESCAQVIAAVHARWPTRMAWRAAIDGWGNGQPAGRRLLHRRTDREGGVASTSPMQTRYVPVGLMYYEGVARLVDAGVAMPGLHSGDDSRMALEGYPRRLAHALIGQRSYKNRDLPDRTQSRAAIVAALEAGPACAGFAVALDEHLRASVIGDASGDRLDAVLCLVQAGVASRRPGYGRPAGADPVEGWIATS